MFHLLFFCPLLPALLSAASIDFESAEGFAAGEPVTLGQGWETPTPSAAVVVATEVFSGEQALQLKSSLLPDGAVPWIQYGPVNFPAGEGYFVSLAIKPVASPVDQAQTSLYVLGWELGFVHGPEDQIDLVVLAGETAEPLWVPTEALRADSGQSDRWLHLLVYREEGGEGSLYLNGPEDPYSLPSTGVLPEKALLLYGTPEHAVYLDAITSGAGFPDLSAFAAGQSLETETARDASDSENILSAAPGGASASLAADASASGESAARSHPGAPRTLYVNNLHGNNGYDGLLPQRAFYSLRAAMAAARCGDTIIIGYGTGVYHEGSRGAPGKRLRIVTPEPVTIK